ncbi:MULTISPECIES: MarR family winged helix-turn-helix transcriptional regulator [unclassified Roseateles]|uniref:MarR family winged helix-turn-helix transcriptional regulator n=1 Tax=unclassified Roseateles TaxID=2626991 RepID=UPI0006FFCC56|nr:MULTISPECIES: MarR family winged helix-turn-helix transcriptional regulator [unclassified Roseateles]KQW43554.1 MarR family transcriptional regulator [Pelomonas sp. Root405]KRA71292.1 MarR family transcriptional regulator [Pelomonas sp. Root662]
MPARASPPPPTKQDDDEAMLVLRQFRQVLNTVKTHFQQVEKKAGLGGAQAWALSVVQQQPGVGVGGLARAMDIHQSTASNLVKALVERSLVEARKEGTDRRSVQLHLLPAGAQALRKTPGPFEGVLPGALRELDAPTLRRLRKDLAKLILVLHADEKSAGIPLGEM